MKTTAILCAALAAALLMSAQEPPPSPPASTSTTLDGKALSIQYSAPSMRGRKIFGDLVPYDKVWRAGANAATSFHTSANLTIGNLNVPAGDYTLYVMPTANQWQLVVNKETGQWGLTYNQPKDLGRVAMKLSKASAPVETYKMTLSATGGKSGQLQLEWENTVATVPITVH
jgi:hypothetical protein